MSIAVVFDLTEKLDNFFETQAPIREIIFDYYINFVPYFMNMFTPLFIFISVIFIYTSTVFSTNHDTNTLLTIPTTTDGVAEIVEILGTAAGDKVRVRFA